MRPPLAAMPQGVCGLDSSLPGCGRGYSPGPPLFLNQLQCHPSPAPGCSQAKELRRAFEACNGAKDCLSRVVQALGGRFKKVHVSRQLAAMGLAKGKFTPDQVCGGGVGKRLFWPLDLQNIMTPEPTPFDPGAEACCPSSDRRTHSWPRTARSTAAARPTAGRSSQSA